MPIALTPSPLNCRHFYLIGLNTSETIPDVLGMHERHVSCWTRAHGYFEESLARNHLPQTGPRRPYFCRSPDILTRLRPLLWAVRLYSTSLPAHHFLRDKGRCMSVQYSMWTNRPLPLTSKFEVQFKMATGGGSDLWTRGTQSSLSFPYKQQTTYGNPECSQKYAFLRSYTSFHLCKDL